MQGSILFCVMGGKMSEGINFSDHLARCVIVIGMPFPDSRDPILQEKLAHANSLNPNSSKGLYESMCMKVVNQSIGRSIRHVNDYASILLLDQRYERDNIVEQLPSWISSTLSTCKYTADLKEKLVFFYSSKFNNTIK